MTLMVGIPVDLDGFLRRECPHCAMEFKWLPTPEGQKPAYPGITDYHCPYCGCSAASDKWFTKAQVRFIEQLVSTEVINPMLEDFERTMNDPVGLVRVTVDREPLRPPVPLPAERNDMRRISPPCHPDEPLKVVEHWNGQLHCLICNEMIKVDW